MVAAGFSLRYFQTFVRFTCGFPPTLRSLKAAATKFKPEVLMQQNQDQQKALLTAAKQAALKAYAPYSRFRVGCAVETDQGIFIGANIENASSNLGICAERVAIAHALMNDAKEIRALAVYCLDATRDQNGRFPVEETMPCGACRQWLAELAPQAVVYTNGLEDGLTVADLLPQAFHLRLEKHK